MWVADDRVGWVGGGGGGGRRLQCVTLPTRLAKNQAALCRDDAGRLHSTRAKNALIAQYNVIFRYSILMLYELLYKYSAILLFSIKIVECTVA